MDMQKTLQSQQFKDSVNTLMQATMGDGWSFGVDERDLDVNDIGVPNNTPAIADLAKEALQK